MLGELSVGELEEWMAWFHLKEADRAEAEQGSALAASVEEGVEQAKGWR